jgi:hypothetical protein
VGFVGKCVLNSAIGTGCRLVEADFTSRNRTKGNSKSVPHTLVRLSAKSKTNKDLVRYSINQACLLFSQVSTPSYLEKTSGYCILFEQRANTI